MGSSFEANLPPDYMYERRVFTLDPQYFPLNRMREIIDYLHAHNQQYSEYSSFNSDLISLINYTNQSS
jgi:hypothetical protein